MLFMPFLSLCRTFELLVLPDESVTILPNMVNIKRFEEKIHGNKSDIMYLGCIKVLVLYVHKL